MTAATRQSSAQSYLQHHRVGALFEELMATLIRDQPQEPLLHLMRSLQRKASDRGLLKQSEFGATAPLRPSTAAPAKSMSATVGGRSYEKPWLAAGGSAGSVKSGMRKSSSGNVAASMADYSAFERQRQQPRAFLTQPDQLGADSYLWSPGVAASAAAAMTTADVAEAEADILGSEFRLAKGRTDASSTEESASVKAAPTDVLSDPMAARGPRHSAAGSRQAAREARMRQLEAKLAESSVAVATGAGAAAASSADSAIGSGADDGEEFEADGVLLMEDADALAAEGVRVSRRTAGVGRAVATSRQRADTQQQQDAEPQVRMTFCGRCFALINADEEAAAIAAVTSRTDSARDVGGFGFLAAAAGGSGDAFDNLEVRADAVTAEYDDLEPFAAPHTGRTNATMTEVTDIESASQVTGPRRPSWGGGGGGTGRSSASKQKQRSSVSSNRGGRGFDTVAVGGAVVADDPIGSRGGWGAAAAAAAAADTDLSDQETERDRHLQQDVRLY